MVNNTVDTVRWEASHQPSIRQAALHVDSGCAGGARIDAAEVLRGVQDPAYLAADGGTDVAWLIPH